MPHITGHASIKFQLDRFTRTPVRVCGKSYRKTHGRVVQNHFSRRFEGCTSQIRSYLKLDFLHDANTSIDMEEILVFSILIKIWSNDFDETCHIS